MDEPTDTRKENERLNKVISILIDRIEHLEKENTILANLINANMRVFASSVSGSASTDEGSTIAEKGNGTPDIRNTIAGLVNGILNEKSTVAEKGKGATDMENTIAGLVSGIIDAENTIAEKGSGTTPKPAPAAVTALHPVEINSNTVWKLSRALKKFYPVSIKLNTLRSVASQLLLLHNQGTASYPELRKISGLSAPGFAKHAPKLKKQGFIRREGYQKYSLTPLSKNLIAQNFPAPQNS
ncbi:MAG: hypothetical protein JJE25_10415 [Bacteroidia bacterium]|nr:hypothetical protein [Bacteroidia bacterium]